MYIPNEYTWQNCLEQAQEYARAMEFEKCAECCLSFLSNHLLPPTKGDYYDCFPQDFDIKEDLQKPIEKSAVPQVELLREEAAEVWDEFRKLPDGARY